MGVVIITKKPTPKKAQKAFITNLLDINPANIDQKEIFKRSLMIKNYLHCLTHPKIARMLYAISLLKITTSSKLREFLQIKSRDPIAYYSLKATNYDLVNIVGAKNKDYELYKEYWKGKVINTHNGTKYYVATNELQNVIPLYKDFFDSLFDKKAIDTMRKEGKYFDHYMESEKDRIKSKDKESERIARITIGACNRCSKHLTKEHKQSKQCKHIAGKLYCSDCIKQMYGDGTMSKILKAHNGKNGRN